jgi:hypothetical protein
VFPTLIYLFSVVPGGSHFKEKNKEKETTSRTKCHVGRSCETSSASRVAPTLVDDLGDEAIRCGTYGATIECEEGMP